MNRTITAKEFLARDYAGLTLVGFDADGYQWSGDERAWEVAAINEADELFPKCDPKFNAWF